MNSSKYIIYEFLLLLSLHHAVDPAMIMTDINIYIGETFRNATSIREAEVRTQVHHFLFALFAMLIMGVAISAATTGRIPLNMLITTGLS